MKCFKVLLIIVNVSMSPNSQSSESPGNLKVQVIWKSR